MVKEILRTDTFSRQLKKLDKSFLDRVEKLVTKIINDPELGKPMRYDRKGTRELYTSSFRLSYAYMKDADTLIFLHVYHKDEQ